MIYSHKYSFINDEETRGMPCFAEIDTRKPFMKTENRKQPK